MSLTSPEQDEIDRAWNYHQAADTLLITRVQALLLAQSFLVVAFAILTTNWNSEKDWPYPSIMIMICLLGTTIAGLVIWKNEKLVKGIRILKDTYLAEDKVYKHYLVAISEESNISRKVFATLIPGVLIVFWIVLAIFVAYSFKSGFASSGDSILNCRSPVPGAVLMIGGLSEPT